VQEEQLLLTSKDRDRLKVLHEAEKGHIPQREAALQLKMSERWVRKLLQRMRQKGDRAVVHQLRGRTSNRKIGAKVQQKALAIRQREYPDFGPTLTAEYLASKHKIKVSRETLRKWMVEAKTWKAKRQRIEQIHTWRARRSCCGELVQWDMSDHDWLEGRGDRIYYVAMIDDATSRVFARFVRHDSTEENMRLLRSYLEQFGRPVEFYTDRDSLFSVNQPVAEGVERPRTQIGRALEELGIGLILARSPQAKGRIERHHQTCQDRLVKGLRKARAKTLEQANQYLENVFLPLCNQRFTVKPANSTDAHRPLRADHNLAAILSLVEERVVANDYTIRWNNQLYQIVRADIRVGLRGARVRVEQRLDGTTAIRFQDRYLSVQKCDGKPKLLPVTVQPVVAAGQRAAKSKAKSEWMKNFDLKKKNRPIWRAEQLPSPAPSR
jgi:DNA-binding Lrp family transcriptional regulator